VEEFVYNMLVSVLNAKDTAPLAVELLLRAGGPDPGPKAERLVSPDDWTPEKIARRAEGLKGPKGTEGDFDD